MALIKCPECGAQVSDQAPVCVQCGYPIAKAKAAREKEEKRMQKMNLNADLNSEAWANSFATDPLETSKLKRLLVLILGSVALTIALVQNISGAGYWLVFLIYVLEDLVLYGAMITHHLLKKKTLPVILASLSLFCTAVFPVFYYSYYYSIGFGNYLLRMWPVYSIQIMSGVLLLLYTIMGKKHRDSIVWFICYLVLMTIRYVLHVPYGIIYILTAIHTVAFFAVGYSPDKWYRKKGT